MENDFVLEVDRVSGCPSAVGSLEDNECLIQEEDLQTSTHHIVSFKRDANQKPEAFCEDEIYENALILSEGIKDVKCAQNLPSDLPECRICQEEDEGGNLEAPCACSGTLKHAHRKCVQRWCNEKGNTICEICNQPYQNGYSAPPRPDANRNTSWGLAGIHHHSNFHDQRINAMAEAEHHLLESEYNDFAAANASGTACCRSAALIFLALLLLRHALAMAFAGTDEDASTFLTLFLLRAAGFLLPCYIMARALDILQRRRQRHEATEVALILQAAQARVHLSVAPGPAIPH